MILSLPENPSVQDFIKAKVQREELEIKYQPIQIPKLIYPKSNLKGASEYAFIKNFLQP